MTYKRWISAVLLFGTVLFFSAPAHANMMIPIIVVGWFGMFVALIPIIVIESAMLVWVGAGVWGAFLAMAIANLASTLVGIPLSIILNVVVDEITEDSMYSPAPYRKHEWLNEKMVPVGGVLLLIPFFLLSWWIEAPIANWIVDEIPAHVVDLAVRDANLLTYSILGLLLGSALAFAIWWPAIKKPVKARDGRIANKRDAAKYVEGLRRRSIANKRAAVKYVEGFRTRQRDIELRNQARPVHSAELLETWRLANKQAGRGIAWLKMVEANIGCDQRSRNVVAVGRKPTPRREKAA